MVQSQAMIAALQDRGDLRDAFLRGLGLAADGLDLRDGLRMTASGGEVVHLRPSGNAPELRIYVESTTRENAQGLMVAAMERIGALLQAGGQVVSGRASLLQGEGRSIA